MQNLVFIGVVTLVAAAAVVYLLLREPPAEAPIAESSAPSPTPARTEERLRFEAAPHAVLMTRLESDARFTVREEPGQTYSLKLTGEESAVSLRITETNGRVSSMTWTFPRPEKPEGKPKNEIEKRIAESYDKQSAALRTRVETLLAAGITACDLNGLLLEPTLRAWYEGALGTLDGGSSYRNTAEGCAFTAHASETDGQKTLICALLFP